MNEIKLEKKEWEECKTSCIAILKNIAVQKMLYELQLEIAERELNKLNAEEEKPTYI